VHVTLNKRHSTNSTTNIIKLWNDFRYYKRLTTLTGCPLQCQLPPKEGRTLTAAWLLSLHQDSLPTKRQCSGPMTDHPETLQCDSNLPTCQRCGTYSPQPSSLWLESNGILPGVDCQLPPVPTNSSRSNWYKLSMYCQLLQCNREQHCNSFSNSQTDTLASCRCVCGCVSLHG